MKRIKKGELYRHVDGFLKTKGVELKPGSYTDRIQRVCGLLSDVINTSQNGLERAKVETEKRLEKVRRVIHEKTAPKATSNRTPPPASNSPPPKGSTASTRKTRAGRVTKPKRRPDSKKPHND
jgi:hypothetical protein